LDILNKARSNKAAKNENDLLEFEKALTEHKTVGQENAAIEQRAQKKTRRKAAAGAARGRGGAAAKGKSRRNATTPPSSPER
jgi:condensin complex subunit 1